MCSKHDIGENRDIFNPDTSDFQADQENTSNWVISEHFKPWPRTRCAENVLLRLSFQYESQQIKIS